VSKNESNKDFEMFKEQISARFKEEAIFNLNLAIKSIETKDFHMSISLLQQAKQLIYSSMAIREIEGE
jgi:hypothetical protein